MALADMEFEEDLLFLELQLFDDFDGNTKSPSSNSGHSSVCEPDPPSISEDSFGHEDPTYEASCASKLTRKRKRMRHRHLKDSEGNWLIPKLHLPRIPKSDIRRSYGLMFANVYNSCDREFAAQFVDRLIPEDYVYVFSKLGWSQALTGPKEALTQFWYEKMHEAPDLLFSFDAERIKVRTDATSVLTGTFSIRGTKLVSTQAQERFVVTNERANDEGLPCEDLSKSSSLLSPASSPPVPISSSPSVAMKMANVAEEPPAGDEVFPVPKTYAFCVSGSMAFHINGDFQIERMEMNVEDYLATLLSSASLSV